MLSAPQRPLVLLGCLFCASALTFASSVELNGICEAGVCPAVDTLSSGASTNGTFNFTYVAADNDWYNIVGSFAASNPASGDTSITFNATAVYEGNGGVNSTASAGADTFTLSDLQNYDLSQSSYWMTYDTLSGYYTESAQSGAIGNPSGSSWTAQLLYNSEGLPVLGPFTGTGSASNGSGTALYLGNSTSTLAADFVFTYDFAQGTTSGSGFTSTPEPSGLTPTLAVVALALGIGTVRRRRASKIAN